ncbi:fungal-specific transcription factor domain-containing protein [Paraphoma chrysanthemicola]|uniref:Fungal-specific transcription factor domain-containing protein n=1 Tax=Paraphoma chrysanthemicola TaxID=798071 RepID=A0A8K0VVG3_9PLEO|nr:fungal-specific transcription factor domain-containing protein [Paraphoma chrysanthemicola]
MSDRRDKAEASAPRKRALVSCDRCKLRRARCIRDNPDEPCADCKLSGVQCESKLPRKQRVYGSVETLSVRYRALESLVKGLFPQENTQDTNVIFKIAAARGISMPANDDFTPADIFNTSSQRSPALQAPAPQQTLPPQSHLPILPSPQTIMESVRPDSTSSPASTSKGTHENPFSEVLQPSRQTEELIPTRHGVPHYFGPSSSFRLATTIRGLVARCKTIQGLDFPVYRGPDSSHSDAASRNFASVHPSNTNLSDEEYTVPLPRRALSPSYGPRGLKRSRLQMEESDNQWDANGSAESSTIADLLPSRPLADALTSAYFDRVHVYLALFHRSMFQYKLEATFQRKTELLKDCTDVGWLICLAMVFSFGCQQLQDHDPDQAHILRLKYLGFVKSYFRKLFLTTSLHNVQAFVLLNLHHHMIGQKSTSWLLIGLAARMAITMGMHRDGLNAEFDPIERNTRRQVWFSIYIFEKILCSILGRPTVIDDSEMAMKIPDPLMMEQKNMSVEFMSCAFVLMQMSYKVRQRAYFDEDTGEERSPSVPVAVSLLRECDRFFPTLPPQHAADFSPLPPERRSLALLLHMYYYHVRCIVSRDFLIQKVERNISYMEQQSPPFSEDWDTTLALSEDCVESAYQSLRCILAGTNLGMMWYSFLDLFFLFHSVMIVCADFLARPRQQRDSPKDVERKEMVQAMLAYVHGLTKLAPTYTILNRIATQFASMTGVYDESTATRESSGQAYDPSTGPPSDAGDDPNHINISDVQEDWFASATTNLGLDFFDLGQVASSGPTAAHDATYTQYQKSTTSEVDDWTTSTLRGMHTM